MVKTLKKILNILLCFSILLTLSGCEQAILSSTSDRYLELVDSPSTTLDNVWYNPGGIFRCAVFESLLIPNADMNALKGALAESYHVSEDGLTYHFQLRDHVTWHDGEDFDTEDVLFSFQTALRTTEINGLFLSTFQYIEGAEDYSNGNSQTISGITAHGNEITIRLTTAIGDFANVIAQFAILPEHLLHDVDPQLLSADDYWKQPIGCGCYQVTEAVEGEYFILEANSDYYGKKAGIPKIRLRTNVADCVEAMQNGSLDFYVTNDPVEIAKLKGLETCSSHRLNVLFPAYLILNLSSDEGVHPSLKDARVRKALLLALDREVMVNAIFPGSSVTNTMIPSWDTRYWGDAEAYDFNPDAAKELLAEADFDYSIPIRLRYFTKGESTKDLLNAIAVYWRAIGITVNVEKFDGSGSEHMFNIRDFDICYKRLSAFDHASIYEEVQGDSVMQTALLGQPVYDDFLHRLKLTLDNTAREDLIWQMQMLDQEYLLRLPLFALANVAYVNDAHFRMPDAYGNLWYRYDLCFSDWKLVNT